MQVAREPLAGRQITTLLAAQLGEQARGHALGIDVGHQQPDGLRLEKGGRQLPQGPGLRLLRADSEPRTQVAQALRHVDARLAHQRENLRFELGDDGRIGTPRRNAGLGRHHVPLPVLWPQVGRVDALGAGQLLDCAVLREQRYRGNRLAGKSAREEIMQRERSALDRLDRRQVELVGLGDVALDCGFAATQQRGTGRQTDQFEHADALVDLLPRCAQLSRFDVVEVGLKRGFGFLQRAAKRLVRGVERLAQFLLNPGQGTDVVEGVVWAVHPLLGPVTGLRCAPKKLPRGFSRS